MPVRSGHVAQSLKKLTFYTSLLAIGYVASLTLNHDARQESERRFDSNSKTINKNLPNIDSNIPTDQPSLTELYAQDGGDIHKKFESQIENLEAKVLHLDNTKKSHPSVKFLPENQRKRILVTGGAGFVGSHLVDSLMIDGHEVIVVDNFFTGRRRNIEHWIGHENFELIHHDVVEPLYIEIDEIYHLACPASPPHYMYNPIKTIKTSSIGTLNMLGLAKRVNAKILLASTSEIYGDPEVHPQVESYWGHVNPIGPRACYSAWTNYTALKI